MYVGKGANVKVESLTATEVRWVKAFQALMKKCPSTRLGAFTVGDAQLTIYDKAVFNAHREANPGDHRDDVQIHDELDTVLTNVVMPFQVDGVCG